MVTKNATLLLKKSATAGAVPAAGSLQPAELAVNLVDRKLYSKDAGGTVFQLAPSMSEFSNIPITAAKFLGTRLVTDFPGWNPAAADMSAYLQTAIDSGYSLLWPAGTYPCKNLRSTVPQSWLALGKVKIVNNQGAGSAVEPLVWLRATAHIRGDFDFDHSAYRGFVNNPAHGGPSIIDGALVISGDDSVIEGPTFRNGHDNGLAVVDLYQPSLIRTYEPIAADRWT